MGYEIKTDEDIVHDLNNARGLLNSVRDYINTENNLELRLILDILRNAEVKIENVVRHIERREDYGSDEG